MLERREYVRLYLPIRVEYKPLQEKGLKQNTIINNIGGGGVCLYGDDNLNEKCDLSLDIYFPDGLGSLSAQGRIIWVKNLEEGTMAGIKFTNISSFDRSRIVSFINMEMQQERTHIIKETSQIVFFKETAVKNKHEILEILLANLEKIESDLRVIDKNIDLPDSGKLDVLCIDSFGALSIIQLLIEEDENVLVRALKHYDWVLRHMDVLGKIYRFKFNHNLRPRVILIAPHFSDPFKRLIESVSAMVNIAIFEYACLESKDSKGIFLKKALKNSKSAITSKDFMRDDKKQEQSPTDGPKLFE
ncbi:MAG: PilZ domain-containing protein [Candidatus Omnitrophica bacterium]|nr:PilZ domain-containing protein [Candidatus Omnitrophota bacterium]